MVLAAGAAAFGQTQPLASVAMSFPVLYHPSLHAEKASRPRARARVRNPPQSRTFPRLSQMGENGGRSGNLHASAARRPCAAARGARHGGRGVLGVWAALYTPRRAPCARAPGGEPAHGCGAVPQTAPSRTPPARVLASQPGGSARRGLSCMVHGNTAAAHLAASPCASLPPEWDWPCARLAGGRALFAPLPPPFPRARWLRHRRSLPSSTALANEYWKGGVV